MSSLVEAEGERVRNQKIKFEMTVKELSFKFEGDVETGQRIQSDMKKTLTALANAQDRLLPHDPSVIEVEATNVTDNGKAGRGRSSRPRRPKANTPRTLVIGLRNEGFFDEKRDISAIQAELQKKGRNFEGNELSPALIALTQKDILKRDKNAEGIFEYERGTNDDTGGIAKEAE
jgi:hypothetical protein